MDRERKRRWKDLEERYLAGEDIDEIWEEPKKSEEVDLDPDAWILHTRMRVRGSSDKFKLQMIIDEINEKGHEIKIEKPEVGGFDYGWVFVFYR